MGDPVSRRQSRQTLDSRLPADGGVDLQPPDEAFPPFLWSNIMQSLIMRETPQDTIWKTGLAKTEQHVRKKFSKTVWGRKQEELGQQRHKEKRNNRENTSDLAAAFCSCFILMASSLTGLGIKVMSAPSFTSRPIHQSLLYFCEQWNTHFMALKFHCQVY